MILIILWIVIIYAFNKALLNESVGNINNHVMAEVVSYQPVTKEIQVWSQSNPCGIYGGQHGTGTHFSLSITYFSVGIIPPIFRSLTPFISAIYS